VVAHCGALSPEEIREELTERGPVEVWLGRMTSCDDFTGDGHVALIVGCQGTTAADMVLTVRDPNPKSDLIEVSYPSLVGDLAYGPWVGTWTNITREAPHGL
jgi:hypothetical protein